MRPSDTDIVFEGERLHRDFEKIVNDKPIAYFKTEAFNRLIGGGVLPHLIILGAEPGCGKTTCLLQMADELAAAGNKVLFFTFELSVPKLVAKSLSRISNGALPVSEITTRHEAEDADLLTALEAYSSCVANNIAFIETPVSPLEISVLVGRMERELNIKPIVFLDYVQISPSSSENKAMDERIAVKETITGLRKVVNGHDVPLFCISSVNRGTYKKTSAGLDSLAESSALEYAADSVLFLSTAGKGDEHQRNMKEPVRPVTLTALKNRYGNTGTEDLLFDTRFATFKEAR